MRIVLDTNVVLSALLWRGTPYLLLESIRQQQNLRLVSSAALVEELADVLTRPSAAKRLAVINKSIREVLTDYVAAIELVEPVGLPRVVPTDPDDDQVIAAAIAAHASLIISGDNDLLRLGSFEGIWIVTPAEAMQRIQVV